MILLPCVENLLQFSLIENDWIIGCDRKFPYVQKFTKRFVLDNFDKLGEFATNSLWRGAFLVEGCNTEEEHNAFLNYASNKKDLKVHPSKLRNAIRKFVPLKIRKVLKRK